MGYNNFICVESVKVSGNSSRIVSVRLWSMGLPLTVCPVLQKFDPVTLDAGLSWEGVLVLKPDSL